MQFHRFKLNHNIYFFIHTQDPMAPAPSSWSLPPVTKKKLRIPSRYASLPKRIQINLARLDQLCTSELMLNPHRIADLQEIRDVTICFSNDSERREERPM